MRTLSFLDLEPLEHATIAAPPELTKQADAVNAEWISRYLEMVADHRLQTPDRRHRSVSDTL